MIQRFVFLGLSIRKTTLCTKIAKNLKIFWVPEACHLTAEEKSC